MTRSVAASAGLAVLALLAACGGEAASVVEDPALRVRAASLSAPIFGRLAIAVLPIERLEPLTDEAARDEDGDIVRYRLHPAYGRMQDDLGSALRSYRVAETLRSLAVDGDATLVDLRREAEFASADRLMLVRVRENVVSFEGRNAWFAPNVFLWLTFWFPAIAVADEDYALSRDVEVTVYAVSGLPEPLWRRTYEGSVRASLNDVERGFDLFGIFRLPGSMEPSQWASVSRTLSPAWEHELQRRLVRDLIRPGR